METGAHPMDFTDGLENSEETRVQSMTELMILCSVTIVLLLEVLVI